MKPQGCVIKVCLLPGETKGLDDYLVAHGAEALQQLIHGAVPFQQWKERTEAERIADTTACYKDLIVKLQAIYQLEDIARQSFELNQLAITSKMSVGGLQKIWQQYRTQQNTSTPSTIGEFLQSAPESPEFVVEGFVQLGAVTVLGGNAGIGKSLLALDFARCVATGEPWNGFPVKQGPVLAICSDMTKSDLVPQLATAGFKAGLPVYVQTEWAMANISALERWVNKFKPILVTIDCLTSCNSTSLVDEWHPSYALPIYEIGKLAERYNFAVILLHHLNREGQARGSTAIAAAASSVWTISRPKGAAQDDTRRILTANKRRHGAAGLFGVEYLPDEGRWAYHGEVTEDAQPKEGGSTGPSEHRVYEFLSTNAGIKYEVAEIVHATDLSERSVRSALGALRSRHMITREERIKSFHSIRAKQTKYVVWGITLNTGGSVAEPLDPCTEVVIGSASQNGSSGFAEPLLLENGSAKGSANEEFSNGHCRPNNPPVEAVKDSASTYEVHHLPQESIELTSETLISNSSGHTPNGREFDLTEYGGWL